MFDPSNYASQLIQQYETVRQTINDGVMIAQQAQALEYQLQTLVYTAQNLQTNPLQLLTQIRDLWSRYNGLLDTADGLTYSLVQSTGRFESAYPTLAGTGLGAKVEEMQRASRELLGQIRMASRTAVKTQSVYEQLCIYQQQNDQALAAAQAAVGNLQVQQALAQQQALANQQQATLIEMQAASTRLQAATVMKQVQEEEAARESNERWLAGYGAGGFRGVKEGKGVTLP